MPTNLVTQGDASVSFPSVNNVLLRNALSTARRLAPMYAPAMAESLQFNQGSRIVRFERIENFPIVTSPLSELANDVSLPTRDGITPTITPINATLEKYGQPLYLYEDLDVLSVNARSVKFSGKIGENAGRSLNAIMTAVYATATNTLFAGGVANVGLVVDAIDENDILEGVTFLDNNDAMHFMALSPGSNIEGSSPIDASYMGICHSFVARDIEKIPGFLRAENYASHVQLMPGEFGTLHDVRWLKTSEGALVTADAGGAVSGTRSTTGTDADVYDTYIVGMEAIASVGLGETHIKDVYRTGDKIPAIEMIYHAKGTSGVGDALNELCSLAWKSWLAGVITNNDWIIRIRTAANKYSNVVSS